MKLLIAASMAAAATNAITIKSACLTKVDLVGNLASGTGVAFDQSTEIYTNLDTESVPTSSNVCVMIENTALTLNLFGLTMDLPAGSSPVTMSNVGPQTVKETFNCATVALNGQPGQLTGAAIYYNADYVSQVSLFIGAETTTFGSRATTDTTSFIQFNTADVGSFIGFHGIASEDHIEALGVITQDIACSADPTTPDNPDTGNGSGNGGSGTDDGSGKVTRPEAERLNPDDDDDNDDAFYIVLATCGGIIFVLIMVGLIVCCCKKRNQRATSKIEMINDPRQESEAELKDGSTLNNMAGQVNSSGNGLPIVETDEERAQGVDVRTNRIQGQQDKLSNNRIGRKDQNSDIVQ